MQSRIGVMDVIPVIDLKGGQVVHACGGLRDEYRPIATPLSPSSAPLDVAAGLLHLFPFRRLYVADLDAIERRGDHAATLAALAATHPGLELWVDNGADDSSAAQQWLITNQGCLVVGSESQQTGALARSLRCDARAVLSLDFRDNAFQGPPEILREPDLWPQRVIVMTLARVGGGQGPDLETLRAITAIAGDRSVYTAGGVRNGADLRAAAEAGAAGALVATALHSGAVRRDDLQTIARP
jgi:phosphoribosylformimino-5-aminoimidazole carboxamide ribotide isomerase